MKLSRYIVGVDGNDLDSVVEGIHKDCPEAYDRIFVSGVASVTVIRCVKHRHVPAYNKNESSGGECTACAVEDTGDVLCTQCGN